MKSGENRYKKLVSMREKDRKEAGAAVQRFLLCYISYMI